MVTDLASGAVIYGWPGKELLGVTEADLHAKGPGALQRLVDPADPAVIQRLNTGAAGLADGQSLEVRTRPVTSTDTCVGSTTASRPSGGTTPGRRRGPGRAA